MNEAGLEVLLDPVGDAQAPEGCTVIETELEFLRHALRPHRLFIRGKELCRWAEQFYRGRGIPVRRIASPSRVLREICPRLSEQQAKELVGRLCQPGIDYIQWQKPADILALLYPNGRWYEPPSEEHSAWWLLWLEEVQISEAEQVVLREQASLWEQDAPEALKPMYEACEPHQAQEVLEAWLGLTSERSTGIQLPLFPCGLPNRWRERISETAKRWYVQGQPKLSEYLKRQDVIRPAKEIVADEGAKYYLNHPSALNKEVLFLLKPYLSHKRWKELEKLLPPQPPGEFDSSQPAKEVLKWVTEQYLPYRKWVSEYGNDEQYKQTEQLAHRFIDWLLHFYPRALQDLSLRTSLVFWKVRSSLADDKVTLLVVLDGLGWLDALSLDEHIQQKSRRLKNFTFEPVLSALPTITRFAKPAIFKGACPSLALDAEKKLSDLGEVLPEGNIPIWRLSQARPGQCFIWRINEPDKTYHERYDSKTIAQDVESELCNLAEKIEKASDSVPSDVPVQVIVTSDHGRLFCSSEKRHCPPSGMQVRERAAWGNPSVHFGEHGYFHDDQTGLLYLHAERFGLAAHVAVPMDVHMFVTEGGKGNHGCFAHGGLYPEEVLVPWLVYVRDVQKPKVEIEVSGSGQAGKDGALRLLIHNLDERNVFIKALRLYMEDQLWKSLPVEKEVDALSEARIEGLLLPSWPAKAQWGQVRAEAVVQVQGVQFELLVQLSVETREMYQKENLLEELE